MQGNDSEAEKYKPPDEGEKSMNRRYDVLLCDADDTLFDFRILLIHTERKPKH